MNWTPKYLVLSTGQPGRRRAVQWFASTLTALADFQSNFGPVQSLAPAARPPPLAATPSYTPSPHVPTARRAPPLHALAQRHKPPPHALATRCAPVPHTPAARPPPHALAARPRCTPQTHTLAAHLRHTPTPHSPLHTESYLREPISALGAKVEAAELRIATFKVRVRIPALDSVVDSKRLRSKDNKPGSANSAYYQDKTKIVIKSIIENHNIY
jgi:hypothetical protein